MADKLSYIIFSWLILSTSIFALILSCNQFTQKGTERVLFQLVKGHILR